MFFFPCNVLLSLMTLDGATIMGFPQRAGKAHKCSNCHEVHLIPLIAADGASWFASNQWGNQGIVSDRGREGWQCASMKVISQQIFRNEMLKYTGWYYYLFLNQQYLPTFVYNILYEIGVKRYGTKANSTSYAKHGLVVILPDNMDEFFNFKSLFRFF